MRKTVMTAGLAGVMMMATAPAMAQTELTFSNWLPRAHPIVADMIVPWIESVEAATEGRVTFEIVDQLGPPPAQYDLVVDGLADASLSVHGYTPGRFVATTLAELPFLGDSAEAVSVAYWRVYEEYLAAAGEQDDVKTLGMFTHGPGQIYSTSTDLSDLGVLDGMKMRVGGGIVSQVADELGVVVVPSPATQAYEILSSGVADGIMFPQESIENFNLLDVLSNAVFVPGGLYNTSFFMVMNQDVWDTLSEEDQAAIDSVSGESFSVLAGAAWDAADASGKAAMEGAGFTIRTLEGEELNQLAGTISDVEASVLETVSGTGVDAAAALAALRGHVAAY